jgi:peptide/nickel transport system substrate-binding protein
MAGRDRRPFVRRSSRILALLVVAALLAAACGGDDDDGGGEAAPAEDDFDPNGVIRWARGVSAGSAGGQQPMDPVRGVTKGHGTLLGLIYGTLLKVDIQGNLSPGLAEEYEIVDPTTITLVLRDDLEFSDGTPYDAAAVKAGLERNVASGNRAMFGSALFAVSSITASSDTDLTIKTSRPVAAELLNLLAQDASSFIVAPSSVAAGTIDTKPVGAGPFTATTVNPSGGKVTLTKNPTYYDADEIKVGAIEIVDAVTPQTQANALAADNADVTSNLSIPLLQQFRSGPYEVLEELNPSNWANIQICQTQAPFDKLEVRQALNYAIDRQAINTALFDGKGEAMLQQWPEGHLYYDEDIDNPYEKRDVAKAKDLLSKAGVTTPVQVKVVIAAGNDASTRLFEVAQQQAKEAGFELTALQSTSVVVDYYDPTTRKAQSTALVGSSSGIDKVGPFFVDDALPNACDYRNSEMTSLVSELRSTAPDDPRAEELWSDISQLIIDEALRVDLAWNVDNVVFNSDKIGGVELATSPYGTYVPDFTKAYVKA